MDGLPLMYSEIAAWWPLLSPPEHYQEEAAFYAKTLLRATDPPPRTVLELGSGGGNNASFMKAHFEMTLVDISEEMLAVSRALNPECAHLQGDMRTLRLGREFDAVFIHDAIAYMTSRADLQAAVDTAYAHTRPGGAALFCPDYVRDTFMESTDHDGRDSDGRAMRYLEWVWDPDPDDNTYFVDYAFVLRDEAGHTHAFHERHEEGLFARDEWLEIMAEAGFEPELLPFEHSEEEIGLVVALGAKPRPAG